MKSSIFHGLNVIDLGVGPVAGLTSMVLADFGATVLSIEKPGGDKFRTMGSSPIWMRGKESLVLNLKTKKDKAQLHELLNNADIVICARSPQQQHALSIEYQDLKIYNKNLIYCSITGFGRKGKFANYPGYDATISAVSGRMQTLASISKREGPSYSIIPVASHATVFNALSGIVAALIEKQNNNVGQLIEISLLKSLMLYDFHELFLNQLEKKNTQLYGPKSEFGTIDKNPALSYQPFLTKDNKWIQTGNLVERLFLAFANEMKLDKEMITKSNQSFHHPDFLKIKEELRKTIIESGRNKPASFWMKKFRDNGNIAAEVYLSTQNSLKQKDIKINKNIILSKDPHYGEILQAGFIGNFSKLKPKIKKPAPLINEHSELTLKKFKMHSTLTKKTNNSKDAPLKGITILEIASVIAAPLASSMLADLGARVIKIEPITGDPFRSYRDEIPITKVNAGKESIAIDLKSKSGNSILQKLILKSNLIIHNNRPGVAERLNFDYKSVKKCNKEIVYVWVNAYGSLGPSANRPGAHPIAGAVLGGALRQAGIKIHNNKIAYNKLSTAEITDLARKIHAANEPSPDPNTSVVAATSMIFGLYAQVKAKQGQHIEVNMLGANSYTQFHEFYNYKNRKSPEQLDNNLLGISPFNRLYKTKKNNNNQWILLIIQNFQEWKKLCSLIQQKDPKNPVENKHFKNKKLANCYLESFFLKFTANNLEKYFIKNKINCTVADNENFGSFLMNNQHSKDNHLTHETKTKWGKINRHSPVINFSHSKTYANPPMSLGQHTKKILLELGYSKATINKLVSKGSIRGS
ncbi:MAG: CoA transferase [Dehalococcoidia bacterium]|nr:CoA transferase [Dehalococcoidia bacterium]